ncbi:MAG: hypothetical protein JHC33_02405 [Ignisphaera sp.]|nr:hypothetical protein [Ignisphaera sp.]
MLNLTALMETVKEYKPLLQKSEDGIFWELIFFVPGHMASEENLTILLSPFLPSDFCIMGWDEVPEKEKFEIYECIIRF